MLGKPEMISLRSIVPILTIFTGMYGPRLSPQLPDSIRNMFNSPIFKAFIMFILLFLGNRDIETSLGIMITYTIASMILQKIPLSENFQSNLDSNSMTSPCLDVRGVHKTCENNENCDYSKCILKTERIVNGYKTNYLNPN